MTAAPARLHHRPACAHRPAQLLNTSIFVGSFCCIWSKGGNGNDRHFMFPDSNTHKYRVETGEAQMVATENNDIPTMQSGSTIFFCFFAKTWEIGIDRSLLVERTTR